MRRTLSVLPILPAASTLGLRARALVMGAALAGAATLAPSAGATAPRAPGGHGTATGSTHDAAALVKRGIAFIRHHGTERGYAEISAREGPLTEPGLYLVVYSLGGRCLAHGANPQQVGRDLLATTDVHGRLVVAERLALARQQPAGFWQEQRLANPITRSVEARLIYCERLDDTAVCGSRLR